MGDAGAAKQSGVKGFGEIAKVECDSMSRGRGHLITSFARSNTRGGIVRPICFATFKLITNSNFVACCTGRSAGLAPFEDFVHVVGAAAEQL